MDSKSTLRLIEETLENISSIAWTLSTTTAKFDQWSQMILLTSYLKHFSEMIDEFKDICFPFVEE